MNPSGAGQAPQRLDCIPPVRKCLIPATARRWMDRKHFHGPRHMAMGTNPINTRSQPERDGAPVQSSNTSSDSPWQTNAKASSAHISHCRCWQRPSTWFRTAHAVRRLLHRTASPENNGLLQKWLPRRKGAGMERQRCHYEWPLAATVLTVDELQRTLDRISSAKALLYGQRAGSKQVLKARLIPQTRLRPDSTVKHQETRKVTRPALSKNLIDHVLRTAIHTFINHPLPHYYL